MQGNSLDVGKDTCLRAQPRPPLLQRSRCTPRQWCGYCHRLESQLDREGIGYEVVDIEQVPDAAFIVEQVNGGNQTVPTLVFADGTAQTNPSVAQVMAKLAA